MIGILWLFLQSAASHLLYLALRLETGSFPKPLSAKEEQAAFAAMRAGDAAARETLICHNLRLVAHIVKKYYTVSGGQDDFISIEFDKNSYLWDEENPIYSRYVMCGHDTRVAARLLAENWQQVVSTEDLVIYKRP